MLDWQNKTWLKIISVVIVVTFLSYDISWATDFSPTSLSSITQGFIPKITNFISKNIFKRTQGKENPSETEISFRSQLVPNKQYASRSLFKNKKVDQNTISSQNEQSLNNIKDALSHKKNTNTKDSIYRKDSSNSLKASYIKDIASIYIPESIGKVIDSYSSPDSKGTVIHIQDLHTNPEASMNLAGILETLIKDYNLDLVCSEGASGVVDTSSVSNFQDKEVREKVAKVFINSGELTGEEYLSITKYPRLPIWGIEDEEAYFQHIIEFNKIMKFSPDALIFINQVKDSLTKLKPEIYSKELLDLDSKEIEYEESRLDTTKYLEYLLSRERFKTVPYNEIASAASQPRNDKGNDNYQAAVGTGHCPVPTKYKNITIFKDTLELEKTIDQAKIMKESQDILSSLQSILKEKDNKYELNTLLAKADLFKDKKISPFSFYSYLDELSRRHIKEGLDNYANLFNFVSYLKKINSLDSNKLFSEIEELTYDIKDLMSENDNQKLLTKSLRNISFLEGFFNLKVSNEELEYYLKDKESFKESWFKSAIGLLAVGTAQCAVPTYGADREDSLIDKNLPDLENFYELAHKRDLAMFNNATSEIETRKPKLTALITGGFHTQGITKLLKENNYSYVVISPYSKTTIDEENYRNLLSGKRKPLSELLTGLNNTLRPLMGFVNQGVIDDFNRQVPPALEALGIRITELHSFPDRFISALDTVMVQIRKPASSLVTRFSSPPIAAKPDFTLPTGIELPKQQATASALLVLHHLPLYLWKPFKERLKLAKEEGELSPEAYERIVTQDLGVSRLDVQGNIVIEEDALPYLIEALNKELKRLPPDELTIEDARDYLIFHEKLHQAILRDPWIQVEISHLFTRLKKDMSLYDETIRDFEALQQAFENNYGAQLKEELLVVFITEKILYNQSMRLVLNKSGPRERVELPAGVEKELNSLFIRWLYRQDTHLSGVLTERLAAQLARQMLTINIGPANAPCIATIKKEGSQWLVEFKFPENMQNIDIGIYSKLLDNFIARIAVGVYAGARLKVGQEVSFKFVNSVPAGLTLTSLKEYFEQIEVSDKPFLGRIKPREFRYRDEEGFSAGGSASSFINMVRRMLLISLDYPVRRNSIFDILFSIAKDWQEEGFANLAILMMYWKEGLMDDGLQLPAVDLAPALPTQAPPEVALDSAEKLQRVLQERMKQVMNSKPSQPVSGKKISIGSFIIDLGDSDFARKVVWWEDRAGFITDLILQNTATQIALLISIDWIGKGYLYIGDRLYEVVEGESSSPMFLDLHSGEAQISFPIEKIEKKGQSPAFRINLLEITSTNSEVERFYNKDSLKDWLMAAIIEFDRVCAELLKKSNPDLEPKSFISLIEDSLQHSEFRRIAQEARERIDGLSKEEVVGEAKRILSVMSDAILHNVRNISSDIHPSAIYSIFANAVTALHAFLELALEQPEKAEDKFKNFAEEIKGGLYNIIILSSAYNQTHPASFASDIKTERIADNDEFTLDAQGVWYVNQERGLRMRIVSVRSLEDEDKLREIYAGAMDELKRINSEAQPEKDGFAKGLASDLLRTAKTIHLSTHINWIVIEVRDSNDNLCGFAHLHITDRDTIIFQETLVYPTRQDIGRIMHKFLLRYMQGNGFRYLYGLNISSKNVPALKHWEYVAKEIIGISWKPIPREAGDSMRYNFEFDLRGTRFDPYQGVRQPGLQLTTPESAHPEDMLPISGASSDPSLKREDPKRIAAFFSESLSKALGVSSYRDYQGAGCYDWVRDARDLLKKYFGSRVNKITVVCRQDIRTGEKFPTYFWLELELDGTPIVVDGTAGQFLAAHPTGSLWITEEEARKIYKNIYYDERCLYYKTEGEDGGEPLLIGAAGQDRYVDITKERLTSDTRPTAFSGRQMEKLLQPQIKFDRDTEFNGDTDATRAWVTNEEGLAQAAAKVIGNIPGKSILFGVGASGWHIENMIAQAKGKFSAVVLVNINNLPTLLLRLRRAIMTMPEADTFEGFLDLLFNYKKHYKSMQNFKGQAFILYDISPGLWERKEMRDEFSPEEITALRKTLADQRSALGKDFWELVNNGLEENYPYLRDVFREDRVVIVEGDLLDKRTMAPVALAMKHLIDSGAATTISMIYFSNIPYLPDIIPNGPTRTLTMIRETPIFQEIIPRNTPIIVSSNFIASVLPFDEFLREIRHDFESIESAMRQLSAEARWEELRILILRIKQTFKNRDDTDLRRFLAILSDINRSIPGGILSRVMVVDEILPDTLALRLVHFEISNMVKDAEQVFVWLDAELYEKAVRLRRRIEKMYKRFKKYPTIAQLLLMHFLRILMKGSADNIMQVKEVLLRQRWQDDHRRFKKAFGDVSFRKMTRSKLITWMKDELGEFRGLEEVDWLLENLKESDSVPVDEVVDIVETTTIYEREHITDKLTVSGALISPEEWTRQIAQLIVDNATRYCPEYSILMCGIDIKQNPAQVIDRISKFLTSLLEENAPSFLIEEGIFDKLILRKISTVVASQVAVRAQAGIAATAGAQTLAKEEEIKTVLSSIGWGNDEIIRLTINEFQKRKLTKFGLWLLTHFKILEFYKEYYKRSFLPNDSFWTEPTSENADNTVSEIFDLIDCYQSLYSALMASGKDINTIKRILDLGMGAFEYAPFYQEELPKLELVVGTDNEEDTGYLEKLIMEGLKFAGIDINKYRIIINPENGDMRNLDDNEAIGEGKFDLISMLHPEVFGIQSSPPEHILKEIADAPRIFRGILNRMYDDSILVISFYSKDLDNIVRQLGQNPFERAGFRVTKDPKYIAGDTRFNTTILLADKKAVEVIIGVLTQAVQKEVRQPTAGASTAKADAASLSIHGIEHRFKQGGAIEIAHYYPGDPETEAAARLTELLKSSGIPYVRSTVSMYDIYDRMPLTAGTDSKIKEAHWLIYGGLINECVSVTVESLMRGNKCLASDSMTWITLPLPVIDKKYCPEKDYVYSKADKIPELIAQHSSKGIITTGKERSLENGAEYYISIPYNDHRYRVVIRKDGHILRIINLAGGPTFVLDFYTNMEDMDAYAFGDKETLNLSIKAIELISKIAQLLVEISEKHGKQEMAKIKLLLEQCALSLDRDSRGIKTEFQSQLSKLRSQINELEKQFIEEIFERQVKFAGAAVVPREDIMGVKAMVVSAIEKKLGDGDPASQVSVTVNTDGNIVKGKVEWDINNPLFTELIKKANSKDENASVFGHIIVAMLLEAYVHVKNIKKGAYDLKTLARLKIDYEKAFANNPTSDRTKKLANALAAAQIYYEMKGYKRLYEYLTSQGIDREKIKSLGKLALQDDEELLGSMLIQLATFMETWQKEGQQALAVANDLAKGKEGHYIVDAIRTALSDAEFNAYLGEKVITIKEFDGLIDHFDVIRDYLQPAKLEKGTELIFGTHYSIITPATRVELLKGKAFRQLRTNI